ncbi:MAG TPA: hypothetical protein PKZ07_00660 [Sedimentisphaerales bacterium]|nr:hypothetical protein [Sedimentisphaerales bacterium]
MNRRLNLTRAFGLTALTCLLGVGSATAAFRAGFALRDVTPDPLLPVSGGVGPSHPVTRTMGRLTARAMVLENNGVRVAICSVDFLGFPGVLGDKVRAQVPSIPGTNILIGATHTHSAPDCYGFPDQTGRTSADLAYLDSVCAKLADAINEAVERLEPAGVKIATGQARGKIAYNYYAEQLYDPRCHVVQILAAGGKPLATLVNYACHPEVIGSDQGILCPDFVGPLYDRIEQRGAGQGIFLNSAQGGMVTADCRGPDGKDIQTWDECVRIGNLLADEALRIVNSAPIQENPTLFCGATTIEFPVENEMLRTVVKMSPLGFPLSDKGTVATQVNIVNLGNAQMLTIPGEAQPNIGFYLKRKMQGEHNLLLGLTNDAFGYMLAKVDWNSFDRYNYITRTCLGEMTGEIFMEKALEFVNRCPRPAVSRSSLLLDKLRRSEKD